MPMLAAASRVIVMSVEGGMMPGPSGREMARHLARSGIAAEALNVKAGARTVGETIIDMSEKAEADLLVKGGLHEKPTPPGDLRWHNRARNPERFDAGTACSLTRDGCQGSGHCVLEATLAKMPTNSGTLSTRFRL